MKLAVLTAALIFVGYLALSSPGELVIDTEGNIQGALNSARESLQGKQFWEGQGRYTQSELEWELGEPARQAEDKREMRRIDAELEREMRDFYRKFPDIRPSRAERKAEELRERADEIEMAELEKELNKLRIERVNDLRAIQTFIVSKIERQTD